VAPAVLPGMLRCSAGRIINIASIAGQVGGVVSPHYSAAKAGVLGLTRGYASWLARRGITVNAIAPALVESDMLRANPRATPDLLPVGRFGTAAEVASAAVLLATNGYIRGQTININGGAYTS
jgi:3-oxoacyl-[acyl-carrier protein] reductase